MVQWLLIVGGLIILWYVIGLAWKKLIRPYFRQQVVDIRTSVLPSENHDADNLDDKVCCFCLAQPKVFRIAATCAHSFCADCILGYYKKNNFERIDCPLCRKDIVALFKAFQQKEPAQKIAQIRQHLKDYNKKFGDDRSIKRSIKQLPFVLEKTMNVLFSNHFLAFFLSSAIFLKSMGAIVVYQFLPYDIMPTALLGSVGYVDNTLVAVLLMAFALGQAGLQYYIKNE